MKRKIFIRVALVLLIVASCKTDEYQYPFPNPGLSTEERVNDLVGRMTLEEKIGQMMNQASCRCDAKNVWE